MAYLLVPREVSAAEAAVWIGAINERPAASQVTLEFGAGAVPLDANWNHWASQAGPTLDYRRVPLEGLDYGKPYSLQLRVDGQVQASAKVTTLPDRLPAADQKPFTILLGSCFSVRKDGAGAAGQTFVQLPPGARPDVKILCGDQVYLDSPWTHYLAHTHRPDELEAEFFANYLQTWNQSGPGLGFQQLLADGANYFSSDDHEYWNNAPSKGAYVRDTWNPEGRRQWREIARGFCRRFQSASTVAQFSVRPLSFFSVDTRFYRTDDKTDFMKAGDLAEFGQWIAGLSGPGVLVLGQPVFTGKTGPSGEYGDWGLADFSQYDELARWLTSSRHSIVILTGDVHYGRVSRCTLPSGVELMEVISSPLRLVDWLARGKWSKAPELFPAFDIPGVPKAAVQTESFAAGDNHFLTLEFSASGTGAKMAVRAWSIRGGKESWAGQTVFERLLQ